MNAKEREGQERKLRTAPPSHVKGLRDARENRFTSERLLVGASDIERAAVSIAADAIVARLRGVTEPGRHLSPADLLKTHIGDGLDERRHIELMRAVARLAAERTGGPVRPDRDRRPLRNG